MKGHEGPRSLTILCGHRRAPRERTYIKWHAYYTNIEMDGHMPYAYVYAEIIVLIFTQVATNCQLPLTSPANRALVNKTVARWKLRLRTVLGTTCTWQFRIWWDWVPMIPLSYCVQFVPTRVKMDHAQHKNKNDSMAGLRISIRAFLKVGSTIQARWGTTQRIVTKP